MRSLLRLPPSSRSRVKRAFQRTFSSVIRRKDDWESVVGLEVHAQISTTSKLFSGAGTNFGAPVNSLVSLFDASIPGTLPVLNKSCVEAAALTAMALSCKINHVSWFDRKHYFYSDLPTGYQITQQRKAIANNGELNFIVYNPAVHKEPYHSKSRIRQLQLEQDSGKSLHVPEGNRSLIDLNRAGVALMEIVFEPDLKDGEEAGALVKELCLILERLGTCSCRMEEGALRVDANISVNRKGMPLGTRSEVKNLSSIRSLVNSIEFEVDRQIKELEEGRAIVNETRAYDAQSKETVPMRDKEEKQDYRFMPEPNLPPLKLTSDPLETASGLVNISNLHKKLKDLPEVTRQWLIKKFGLRLETAIMIVNTPGFLSYFNAAMEGIDPKLGMRTASFIGVEIMQYLNENNKTLEECPVEPKKIGQLILLLDDSTVNFLKATAILQLLLNGDDRSPNQIVQDEGWVQITDHKQIELICRQVLEENPSLVTNYKTKKKPKYINKLIGIVKTKTDGKYDMKQVTKTLENLLNSEV